MEHFVIIVNGFNYYHKALHRGCCNSPRPASEKGHSWLCAVPWRYISNLEKALMANMILIIFLTWSTTSLNFSSNTSSWINSNEKSRVSSVKKLSSLAVILFGTVFDHVTLFFVFRTPLQLFDWIYFFIVLPYWKC